MCSNKSNKAFVVSHNAMVGTCLLNRMQLMGFVNVKPTINRAQNSPGEVYGETLQTFAYFRVTGYMDKWNSEDIWFDFCQFT